MMSLTCIGVLLLIQTMIIGLSEALFEGCDHTYNLNANTVVYLQSPYYPNKYPSGSSCRYRLIAPLDYEILAECTIAIDKNPNACSTEHFYISRDGDANLNGAEQFCGNGTITRTTLFRNFIIAYASEAAANSGTAGVFDCILTTRPQACDCGWSVNTKIVGGEETAKGEFPFMVGLYSQETQSMFCGGSIISHRAVLTATHCTRLHPDPNQVLIIAGDHDLNSSTESQYATTYRVSQYIEHADFDSSNNVNDIAILITTINIEWSRGVGPVCLPLDQLSNTFDYTNVNVVGWGTTSFAGAVSNTLQKASVNILPNSACQSVYPGLQSSQVCTYFANRDACQFDSGGPVVYKGVKGFLLGIISYGFACGTNPGVNTRMTSFINWLNNYSLGTLCSKPFN